MTKAQLLLGAMAKHAMESNKKKLALSESKRSQPGVTKVTMQRQNGTNYVKKRKSTIFAGIWLNVVEGPPTLEENIGKAGLVNYANSSEDWRTWKLLRRIQPNHWTRKRKLKYPQWTRELEHHIA